MYTLSFEYIHTIKNLITFMSNKTTINTYIYLKYKKLNLYQFL